MIAAESWYAKGFALGAAGAKPTQRRGRPRLRAMVGHWRRGIRDGAWFCRELTRIYGAGLRAGGELVGEAVRREVLG